MYERISLLLVVLFAVLYSNCMCEASAQGQTQDGDRSLKAGFAWAEIMPDQIAPDTIVHSTLKTKVAVFDDGRTRIGFVSVDAMGIGSPGLVKHVRDEAQTRLQPVGRLNGSFALQKGGEITERSQKRQENNT